MQEFVHLHVHTQYSMLDGQSAVKALVKKAIADGMRGMAITDHGNMMAIKEFHNHVNNVNADRKKDGLEPFIPIFGCEMYVANNSRFGHDKDAGDNIRYHLIVLAKNEKGYHNLIKLVSHAWVEGYYMRPRTDREELEKYHEGLIICSACIAGEVPNKILKEDIEGAEEAVQWYKRVFGDDYYLELQRHKVTDPNIRANRETYPMQQKVNSALLQLAEKYQIKVVCTNDAHFVNEDDAEAHDRLLCLGTGRDLDDPERMLYSKQEWFKTTAEMNAIFQDVSQALSNTVEILNKVEIYSIDHKPIMPNFPIPKEFGTEESYRERYTDQDLFEEFSRDENGNVVCSPEEATKKIDSLGGVDKLYRLKLEADYLRYLTYQGAVKIYGAPIRKDVDDAIRFELHVMKTMGFPGYFLIVQDYINAARHELGVSVGPGRGSAAGSVVAFCLGITKMDPIKYNLLFERFLNPDRISLPDIDVDFDDDGRSKVLQWITMKYGEANVTHIITYGTMATKSAIRDVARVQKVPLQTSQQLVKAIPDKLPDTDDGKARKMTITNAMPFVQELQQAAGSPDPLLRETIKYAEKLEGTVRNTGVHACGVIICKDDVSDWVPVSTAEDKETGEKLLCTQYEGKVIEETGLIKMDFLGLKTLSILNEALRNIHDSLGIDVVIDNVDIEDPATFNLFCEGLTVAVFQFESPGMQKHLRDLKPTVFEDLIAMNALYRPGPMQYIPDFIKRKHGEAPVIYDIDCMKEYLEETYGITVYQEQVMLLSRLLANFTRGESDTLRKAMGKKLKDKLDHMYPKFIAGGKANGHDEKVLEKIWHDWEAFASYAFNKSHSTCYAWVAFQTAYLKANYPAEFMAAVMTRSFNEIKEITKLMAECRDVGIATMGPDVNHSRVKFSVDTDGNIRFGLAAIKGLGAGAAESIVKEREANGPYKNIFDFIQRVRLSEIKRNGLESLIQSGALDVFTEVKREQYYGINSKGNIFIDALIRHNNLYQQEKASSELTLFGDMDDIMIATPEIPAKFLEWSSLEKLNKEKEHIGIYMSANPLDDYEVVIQNLCSHPVRALEDYAGLLGSPFTVGGFVTSVSTGMTKMQKSFGRVTLEDYSGKSEITIWDEWAKWEGYFKKDHAVRVSAHIEPGRFDPSRLSLKIDAVTFLGDLLIKEIKSITIWAELDTLTRPNAESLMEIIAENPGDKMLRICFIDSDTHMNLFSHSHNTRVNPSHKLLEFIASTRGLTYSVNDLDRHVETVIVEEEEKEKEEEFDPNE